MRGDRSASRRHGAWRGRAPGRPAGRRGPDPPAGAARNGAAFPSGEPDPAFSAHAESGTLRRHAVRPKPTLRPSRHGLRACGKIHTVLPRGAARAGKAGPDRPGQPVSRRIMPHPHDARRGLVQNLAIRKANHVVSERSRLNDGADPPRSARPGPQMGARAPFRAVLKRSGGSPHMRGRLGPHIAAPARKRRRGMCERTAT